MLFFAVVSTAFAQITDLNQLSNDKTYFIESARCFLTYSSAHTGKLATSNGTTVPAEDKVKNPVENENQQFKILNEGGSYYLYSVGAGKYVDKSGNYVDTPTDALTITNIGSGGSFSWKILIGGNGLNSQDPNQTEAGVVVNDWTTTDAGNCFKITAIEDIPVRITDLSKLSNSKLYSIVPKDAARGALYATSTSTRLDACGGTYGNASNRNVAVDHKSPDQQFALYNHEGNIYLYSVGASKFVGGIEGGRYFQLTDTPTHRYTVEQSDEEGYFIIKLDNSNYINVSTGWEAGCVGAWATQDDGNRLVISAVANMPESVSTTLYNAFNTQRNFTYTFIYNGVVKATQTCSGNVGEAYPEVDASLLPFGVTATKPEGNIPSDVASNFDLNLTIDLPFEPAADYNSITKWYYLKFHASDRHPLYYPGDESVLLTNKNAVDATNKDAYTWAFIGNPFDGFKVVNKAAGADKALVASANGAIVSAGTDNLFKFTTSGHATNGFFIQCTTGDYQNRFNRQDGKVVYWSGADAGSTFMVEERDMTGAAELQALIEQIIASADRYTIGTEIGYYTEASVDAVTNKVAEAQEVLNNPTVETVSAAQIALQNAVNALEMILPQEGRFYTIESALYENDYVYAGTDNKVYHNTDRTNASSEAIWQFVKNDDGSFRLYSVSNNQYISELGWQVPSRLNDASEMKFTFEPQGKGVVFIKGNGNEMHAQVADRALVRYNTNTIGSASSWIVKEVTEFSQKVNVSGVGYSTLMLGYNAEIPADVNAYTVNNTTGNYAVLNEVTGILPAATPVILIAPEAEYTFEYSTEEPATVENNLLVGTLFNKYVEGAANTDYYVLSMQNEVVGLYKAMLNKTATGAAPEEGQQGTHFLNNAFKAYLPLTTGSGVNALRFNFDGETTAIDAVEVENANAPIYDLSGRRVLSTVKGGVYIQNGKKFIVK